MSSSFSLSRNFTSFSGTDIKVLIDGHVAGTMLAVSYAIQREKAPIYVMGRVDPLSFSRGKRGIAGTMISVMMDQHLVYREPWATSSSVILDNDEIIPTEFGKIGNLQQTPDAFAGLGTVNGGSTQVDREITTDLSDEWSPQAPNYVDQIMPFDISIVAVNEYGRAAMMRIYGCEILNEGSGYSIDDIVIENQMTYICRTILPWKRMGRWTSTEGRMTPESQYRAAGNSAGSNNHGG